MPASKKPFFAVLLCEWWFSAAEIHHTTPTERHRGFALAKERGRPTRQPFGLFYDHLPKGGESGTEKPGLLIGEIVETFKTAEAAIAAADAMSEARDAFMNAAGNRPEHAALKEAAHAAEIEFFSIRNEPHEKNDPVIEKRIAVAGAKMKAVHQALREAEQQWQTKVLSHAIFSNRGFGLSDLLAAQRENQDS